MSSIFKFALLSASSHARFKPSTTPWRERPQNQGEPRPTFTQSLLVGGPPAPAPAPAIKYITTDAAVKKRFYLSPPPPTSLSYASSFGFIIATTFLFLFFHRRVRASRPSLAWSAAAVHSPQPRLFEHANDGARRSEKTLRQRWQQS